MSGEDTTNKPDPKKRLGRGLDALFGDEEESFVASGEGEVAAQGSAAKSGRQLVGIDQLDPGEYQPRHVMNDESLKELSDSIAVHGVLQPLLVRPKGELLDNAELQKYEIIAGERRWRAAQIAMLHEVPVIIKELTDLQAMELGLIENLQREDLNSIEEALGYSRLIEQFGHTQEQVAQNLGKSRSHIANTLRLLTLPEKVQAYIELGKLTAGHARALVTADNPEELAEKIINDNLSVRDAEKFAKGSGAKKSKSSSSAKSAPAAPVSDKDVDTLALEDELSSILGMRVEIDIKGNDHTKGTLRIDFSDLDQLDEVLHRLSHFPGRQQTG